MSISMVTALVIIGIVSVTLACLKEKSEHVTDPLIMNARQGDEMVISGEGKLTFSYVRVDSASAKTRERDRKIIEENEEPYRKPRIVAGGKIVKQPPEKIVMTNSSKSEIFFAFNDTYIRCDSKEYLQSLSLENRMVFDGKKTIIGNRQKVNDTFHYYTSKGKQFFINTYDPRYNGIFIFGKPVTQVIKGKRVTMPPYIFSQDLELRLKEIEISGITSVGEALFENRQCRIFRGYDKSKRISFTVWLAQDLYYRPVRMEIDNGENLIVYVTTFRKYENDVWFQVNTVIEQFYRDSITGEKILYSRAILKANDDFRINIDIPENVFKSPFREIP